MGCLRRPLWPTQPRDRQILPEGIDAVRGRKSYVNGLEGAAPLWFTALWR